MCKSTLRIIVSIVFCLWGFQRGQAQFGNSYPKLVVGVIVDQMRFDHLYKYRDRYGQQGFNRLLRSGFNFKNANYNYIPTLTAPGHASIYSGATPSVHGIIGNTWYDRTSKKVVGNVDDSTVTLVGSKLPNNYGASPKKLLTTTISDQLRMATNYRSKVISMSLKDRGAILPGGHTANAAYWQDTQTSPGYFVSSSYYMEKLPDWVTEFNTQEKTDAFLNETWTTLYPLDTYVRSAPDDNAYERAIGGKKTPTFPYDLGSLRGRFREAGAEYQLLWVTPYGNSLLTQFAIETLNKEGLGTYDMTDVLWISYSVTDIIGHTLGPQSVEMEDVFLRLDKNIAELLAALDEKLGRDNYLLFLTSDHGSVPVASHLKDQKLPTGIASIPLYELNLLNHLNRTYGAFDWIDHFDNEQVYLNRELIAQRKLKLSDIQQAAADYLMTQEGISGATTAHQLSAGAFTKGIKNLVQNGYYAKRSGDVILTYEPGYVADLRARITVDQIQGTNHGTGYAYDTHVPMLWYGKGIEAGESVRRVSPVDIAPTLSMMLDIQDPSGSSGEPLKELLEN